MAGKLTVAVLGAGKMGRALIASLAREIMEVEILATARSSESLKKAEELGAKPLTSNSEAARRAELVVLSVKPRDLPLVLREIKGCVEGKAVISFVAGVRIETLCRALPGAEVYRAMPTVNAVVGRSTTALAACKHCVKWRSAVKRVLEAMGAVFEVPEELLDAWTAVIGSGPAYVAEFVESMIMAALLQGISVDMALQAVLDMVEATVKHLRVRGLHPAALRDEVATPGGTTIAGLHALWSHGFRAAIMEAVARATRRCRELSAELESSVLRGLEP